MPVNGTLCSFPFLCIDLQQQILKKNVEITTSGNGSLGSRNDEERSEMRYAMRIAEFRESSDL